MKKQFFIGVILITMLLFSAGCDENKQISGVVVGVDYIATASSFGTAGIENTIVEFKDGRVKVFNGISEVVIFQKNKINVITYSENRIVSVEIM
ncbi:hypothetical protein KAJ89_04235 [Candidatus Parcubacteria bacterium]|nr:hypothetical protein [Candidatus Parcubacteria bacterium]